MRRIWALCRRVSETPFGKTLIAWIVIQGLILIFIASVWSKHPDCMTWLTLRGVEQTQTAFLLLSVYLLVAVNTVIFLVKSLIPVHRKLDETTAKSKGGDLTVAIALLIIGVGFSGAMTLAIVLSFCPQYASDGFWGMILLINEFFSVALFAGFLYADKCCLDACRTALRVKSDIAAEDRKKLAYLGRSIRLYIMGCDAPALLGLLIILILDLGLRSHAAGLYLHGFSAGAIGLQIAFSQTALALLGVIRKPEKVSMLS